MKQHKRNDNENSKEIQTDDERKLSEKAYKKKQNKWLKLQREDRICN